MELKITESLLKAMNFNGNIEILKILISNYTMDFEMKVLNNLEIDIINRRYEDNLNERQTYKEIAARYELIILNELPKIEQNAKRNLALYCLNLPVIPFILKNFLIQIEKSEYFTFQDFDMLENFLSILPNELIYSYKDYASNYSKLNDSYFKKDPSLKSDMTNLWKYLGFFNLFSYAFPSNLKNNRNIHIADLNLSSRIVKAISLDYGNLSLEQFLFFQKEDLMQIKNLGKKSYKEVLDKIHALGLNFFYEMENNFEFEELNNQQKYYQLIKEKKELKRRLLEINTELKALEAKKN